MFGIYRIGRRYRLSKAVKESFDNLPIGVCFFDKHGIVTLCNRRMYKLIYELKGIDIQHINELKDIFSEHSDGAVMLIEGRAWRFRYDIVSVGANNYYSQVIATDVNELYTRQLQLEDSSRKLEQAGERMRRLTDNIRTVIREEEILNMKIRVHDDIGRSVIATRSLLENNKPTSELDLTAWKNAVKLLMRDNETPKRTDISSQLSETSSVLGIKIIISGEPFDAVNNKIIVTAIRECATNAVRHAGATELTVHCSNHSGRQWITISNNGRPPKNNVTQGGGLSSLHDRIIKSGGTMSINSYPVFELVISFPLHKEVIL